jgi:hypothetical protein
VHGTIETGLSLSQRDFRFWIAPAVWALAITALLGVGLARLPWQFVDLYNNFYKASALSWHDTIRTAFGSGVEYRPLLIVGMKLAHQLVGLRQWAFQALVLLQFAAVLALLLWIFRPTSRHRAVAACVALACAVGLHTSRVLFLIAPLNAHSIGVVLLLAGVALALTPRSPGKEWAFLVLTLIALLLLESGILIVAVTLVLWRMRAPGASGRAVTATVIAALLYAGIRFGFGAQVAASTYTETGLGFEDVSAARLGEIFAHAPWMLWLYNVASSVLTVAASEPRAGRFFFVNAILSGQVPVWMYIHVVSSVLSTAIIWYALRTSRISEERDRFIAAAAMTIVVVGSALGFLYTRDRIAVSAGVGYAMLVYVAVAAVLERVPARRAGLVLSNACVAIIAVGWLVRTGEAYVQMRDAAWENYQEWTTRYEELGGFTRPQTDILTMLRSSALEVAPEDPRRDPRWTYVLFEREFERAASP